MTQADELWDKLETLGFDKEERPEGFLPAIPHDITVLTDPQLMVLYGAFVSWSAYASMRVVGARANASQHKQDLALSTARASLQATMEKTVAGRKAAAATDVDVRYDEDIYLRAQALAEALEAVHKNSLDRAQFCSRELTRRGSSARVEERAGKWTP